MSDDLPRRRVDDARFDEFSRKIDRIERKVDDLRDVLAEPEQSPLGRNLLRRADVNAGNIARHESRIDSLESWRDQMKGSWGLVRVIQAVLAIAVAILTAVVTLNGGKLG